METETLKTKGDFIMEGKVLDLTMLSEVDVARVKSGFSQFQNNKGVGYFGAVLSKKDVKALNRLFGYVDKRSWIAGALFGIGSTYLYLKCKELKESTDETKDEK